MGQSLRTDIPAARLHPPATTKLAHYQIGQLGTIWSDTLPKTWQQGQSLCGTVRSLGPIVPLGVLFSLRLQQQITRSMKAAFGRYRGTPAHLRFRRIPRAEKAFVPSKEVIHRPAQIDG